MNDHNHMGRLIWTQEAQNKDDIAGIIFLWDRRLAECSLQDLELMFREITSEVDSFIASHPDSINDVEDPAMLLVGKLQDLVCAHQDRIVDCIGV